MTSMNPNPSRQAWKKACYIAALMQALLPAQAQEVTIQPDPRAFPAEDRKPLRYGPFDIFPHLGGGVMYDDNIYIQPNNEVEDVIWSISPGVTLGAGDYQVREESLMTLRYSPNIYFFTHESKNNSIDHDLRFNGRFHPASWIIELEQTFQRFSGPVVDVGNRIDRNLYNTTLSLGYEISPKTSVELNGRQSINDYGRAFCYNEWIGGGYVDYAITPKVKFGGGVNIGVVDIKGSANQIYEQLIGRVSYALTEKVQARASAGVELRQFEGDQDDRVNGVFSLGGTYTPLQNTTISFDGYRRDQTSVVLRNQNYTLSGINAAIRQIIFEKYAVGVGGGYENYDYHSTAAAVTATREDDYLYARVTADWFPFYWLNVGVFYQYRDNQSTSTFDFVSHQFGLTIGYQF